MNIRDSYIHGADGKGVVKKLFFATTADTNAGISVNDLVFLLADTLGTQVPLTIPILNLNTTGSAGSLKVVKRGTDTNHYLTFVANNNTTAAAESFYTDGDLYYNPLTNILNTANLTVRGSNGFNYSGIGLGSDNSTRPIWFSYCSSGTYVYGRPVYDNDFTYNPSTNTLTIPNISGASVWIGDTQLLLNSTGTTNKLTPDTSISHLSTNGTIPSSKAVYDAIIAGIGANDAMVFKGFLNGGSSETDTTYTPGADRGHTYKVQTAGYINGTYYQVNDTFICTTDETVAANSTNVSTVKANWGVVEGNGDYLSYNGGTMYGTLTWKNSTALPSSDTVDYILMVTDTTEGVTKYITKAKLRSQLASGMYWADKTISTSPSNDTTPRFGKVGIGGEVDGTAKLKVYGGIIVTGTSYFGGLAEFNDTVTFLDDTNYYGTARFSNDVKMSASLTVDSTTRIGGRLQVSNTIDGGDNSLVIGDITASGTIRANNDLITMNIKPKDSDTYNIGNTSKYYTAIYARNLYGNASTASTWETSRTFTIAGVSKTVNGSLDITWTAANIASGLYWANVKVSASSSAETEPQFAKVGIAGAKDSNAKLKVYGNEIVTGNLTIGGCTLVYDSSTPCLKFTF